MSSLFFLSTNTIWGGSEILWSQSAKTMAQKGYSVHFLAYYDHPDLVRLVQAGAIQHKINNKTDFVSRASGLLKRKLGFTKKIRDGLYRLLNDNKPDLLIISQGNNFAGNEIFNLCVELEISFVTITQLVSEYFWMLIDDRLINSLKQNYKLAKRNFFVSQANLKLNDNILSKRLENSEVVYNPFNAVTSYSGKFPPENTYHIAIVGRLECTQKGIDILIEVVSQQKWRDRAVVFTFYGNGPHKDWLTNTIANHKLINVQIAGHVKDVKAIWDHNHILLMPSRMEGQSLALIEAMYCGRAAIVTDVGGVKELIADGENGFIARSASKDRLDETMEVAWQERTRWKAMGELAREVIRKTYPSDPVEFFNNKLIGLLK
jgi:glycosyltransferase involved in cell wall biosynthesis